MKKTLSLLLVFALMLTILAMPAAAATTENEVDPCALASQCIVCRSKVSFRTVKETRIETVEWCTDGHLFLHEHSVVYDVTYAVCSNGSCGAREIVAEEEYSSTCLFS